MCRGELGITQRDARFGSGFPQSPSVTGYLSKSHCLYHRDSWGAPGTGDRTLAPLGILGEAFIRHQMHFRQPLGKLILMLCSLPSNTYHCQVSTGKPTWGGSLDSPALEPSPISLLARGVTAGKSLPMHGLQLTQRDLVGSF